MFYYGNFISITLFTLICDGLFGYAEDMMTALKTDVFMNLLCTAP